MTTQLTNRDQLDIAINGSQQFHAKAASAKGDVSPDTVIDGHREIATQLKGLAALFGKTAEYVEQGYPAKIALDHLAREAKVDPEYAQKLASSLDDLGELVLKELVLETFEGKVREKTAQAKPDRVSSAVGRMTQLASLLKK